MNTLYPPYGYLTVSENMTFGRETYLLVALQTGEHYVLFNGVLFGLLEWGIGLSAYV
jgi:hypothetical protein